MTNMYARPGTLDYSRDNDLAVSRFFQFVYAYMAMGLVLTGVIAWYVANHAPWVMASFDGGMGIVIMLGLFAMAVGISSIAPKVNVNVGILLFLLYCAAIGVLLSYIFVVYTSTSIASTFLVTGGMFFGMSLFGMVTKRDLSGVGSFLMMGFWGILLASIVNVFLFKSEVMYWAITYIGVAVFTGLIAYRTQDLKQMAMELGGNPTLAPRVAVVGALMLYITFINLFTFMLRIMGSSRD